MIQSIDSYMVTETLPAIPIGHVRKPLADGDKSVRKNIPGNVTSSEFQELVRQSALHDKPIMVAVAEADLAAV